MIVNIVGFVGLLALVFVIKKALKLIGIAIRIVLNPIHAIRNVYAFLYAMIITIQRERSNFKNGVK